MTHQQTGEVSDPYVVVPSGAPAWVTAELLIQTLRVWQPYYSNQLTVDEAMEILSNTAELFRVVSKNPSDP